MRLLVGGVGLVHGSEVSSDAKASEGSPVDAAIPRDDRPSMSRLEAPNPLTGAPLEILAAIVEHLSIEDYVRLFSTSHELAATHLSWIEERLLKDAAEKLADIDPDAADQEQRMNGLLGAVRSVYRIRAGLPPLFRDDVTEETLKKAADVITQFHDECVSWADLAGVNGEWWKGNCLQSFSPGNLLILVWPHLSAAFQRDQRVAALWRAAERGDPDAFAYFLTTIQGDEEAIVRSPHEASIPLVVKHGSPHMLRFVLQTKLAKQTKYSAKGSILGAPLVCACKYGRLDILQDLLELGRSKRFFHHGPVNVDDLIAALCSAMERGYTDIVRHFLSLRGNPAYQAVDAFQCAVFGGKVRQLESLFGHENGRLRYAELIVSDVEVKFELRFGDIMGLELLLKNVPAVRIQQYIDTRLEAGSLGRQVVEKIGLEKLQDHYLPLAQDPNTPHRA